MWIEPRCSVWSGLEAETGVAFVGGHPWATAAEDEVVEGDFLFFSAAVSECEFEDQRGSRRMEGRGWVGVIWRGLAFCI